MGRNNNYSYQHLWVGFLTSSRWLSGESSGMVIWQKGKTYYKRKFVSRICRQGVAVVVLEVW